MNSQSNPNKLHLLPCSVLLSKQSTMYLKHKCYTPLNNLCTPRLLKRFEGDMMLRIECPNT